MRAAGSSVDQQTVLKTIVRSWLFMVLLGLPGAGWADADTSAATASDRESVAAAEKFDRGPLPIWITTVAVPDEQLSTEPNTLRLADTQLRWDASGENAFRHFVMKANTAAGIPELGQLALEFNPAYQMFHLHVLRVLRNGVIIDKLHSAKVRFLERELGLEQSVYNGAVTVSILIDDIRVGDSLEYAYSEIGSNPVFKDTIADYSTWQFTQPVQLRRVSVSAPVNRPIQYHFIGASSSEVSVRPTESNKDGFKELIFEAHDMAPVRLETAYPLGYQPFTWLQFSEYRNWNQVAKWATDLFKNEAPDSDEFKALVTRWRGITDPTQRAAEALSYVQSEIRYTSVAFGENSHRPAAPADVLQRRYGDCKDKSLLLVSLYRALGFNAKPVLVGVNAHNGFADWLPSPMPFDHVIVRLDLKGTIYWLDPTAIQKSRNLQHIGKLHGGNDVLIVDPKSDRLTRIEENAPDVYAITEHVYLNDLTGPATMEKVAVYVGVLAENVRFSISQTPLDQLKKNAMSEVQRIYGMAEWAGELKIDDDIDNNKITLTQRVLLSKYVDKQDDGWILRHRPNYIASFFIVPDAPNRTAPFGLEYPVKATYIHEVQLPANAVVSSSENTIAIADPYFSVTQVKKHAAQSASTEYTFETLARQVPAADMDRFVSDIRKVQHELQPYILVTTNSKTETVSNAADVNRIRADAAKGVATAQFTLAKMFVKGDGLEQDYKEALVWYRKAAEQGYAEAQAELGVMYYLGVGTTQDYEAAFKWLRLAANNGITKAQYYVAVMYGKGQGTKQDYKEALVWYNKVVAQGYAPGIYDMAVLYENGIGVTQDLKQAATLYRKIAEQGVAEAQTALGLMYARGRGVTQDLDQAASWYRKAADQGNAVAEFDLGLSYELGHGVPQDYEKAVLWHSSAAKQGLPSAEVELGMLYATGRGVTKDYKEAMSWWRKAADQDNATAQTNVGALYEQGLGVPADTKEAVSWYRKAADQGYARAQYSLARMYFKGEAVAKNESTALMWLRKAAEQGYASAQNDLGVAYEHGNGMLADSAQAVSWYRKAAEQNDATAQNNLGVMIAKGLGATKDYVQAYMWLILSVSNGAPDATKNRDVLMAKLTQQQISDAQKLAREWKPKMP